MKKKTDAAIWKMILLFTMLLWSSNYIVTVSLLESYAPTSLVVFRLVPACIALISFSLISKSPFYKLKITRKEWIWFLLATLAGSATPTLFISLGVKYAGASLASILMNTSAFIIAIIAVLIGTETLNLRKFGGISLGIIGLALVVLRGQSLSEVLSSAEFKGMIFSFIAALGVSIYTIIIKAKLLPKFGSLNTTLLTLIPASIIVLILGLVLDPQGLQIQNTTDLLQILFLGVVTTAMVWLIFTESLHHLDASEASTFKLLIPPCAALLAFLFYGEALSWQFYIGMGIVLTGIYLVTHKKMSNPSLGQ